MSRQKNEQLVPKNGRSLIVGIVARISGCANQKELSLDDQVDHGKQITKELFDGPTEYRVIATKGKGERLDRPELDQIRAELLTGELDLLVMEDMGRLVRGPEAIRLFGVGVDHGTRCISPNDRVDTINPTWEEDALAACRDHVAHNAHTSRRLKQKLMNRFEKFGGATARPIAGYIVPEDAKTYGEWRKDDEATPIILKGAEILRETRNGQAVADYFTKVSFQGGTGFPVGPYCRRAGWNGPMVLRFYRNTLLSGRPRRGARHTIKHYETGRRIAVPNPDGPVYRDEPHLAHLEPVEQDDLIAILDDNNARFRRKGRNESDPRWRTKRKRSHWPGQAGGLCWYCGSDLVWGGNGITGNLMCSGAREWNCWNSVGFSGRLSVEGVMNAIMSELDGLTGVEEQLRDLVLNADVADGANLAGLKQKIRRDESALTDLRSKGQQAIKAYGANAIVDAAIAEYEQLERQLRADRRQVAKLQGTPINVPSTVAELRSLYEEQFRLAAEGTYEFGDFLRRIIPEFHVYLVRLCDGGPPLPRLRVQLALDGILPDATRVNGLAAILSRRVTLDVFAVPPHEQIRAQTVRMAREGAKLAEIVQAVSETRKRGVSPVTVKSALALQREMEHQGLSSPYLILTEPPDDYRKLRRHRSAKYRFAIRGDYVAPTLDA